MADTKSLKDRMKIRYGNQCMLTGVKYRLTYHHLIKRTDGGRETIHNGVLLTERIHCKYLHCIIEKQGKECYEAIQQAMKDYKEAIDNEDWEFVDLYERIMFPVFYEKLKLHETRRRVRKNEAKRNS